MVSIKLTKREEKVTFSIGSIHDTRYNCPKTKTYMEILILVAPSTYENAKSPTVLGLP
jgi:hypothetical protein